MLLKKNLLIYAILFLLLVSTVSAEVCEVDRIKQVLKKILFLYYTEPGSVPLTKDEVKDMLVFYLSISDQNLTVECSAFGSRSNTPISDVVNKGESVSDKIPSCQDGTKYGECSKFRPAYCYAGALYSKCDLCGCPANSVCGKSKKCDSLTQNVTCFKDIDCGQNTFVGDYYCTNNYVSRNGIKYFCLNAGISSSKCESANGTVLLTYCDANLNQFCVAGQSTCQSTLTSNQTNITIAKTNVRCEISYNSNVQNNVKCNVNYNGQLADCTISAASSGYHLCDPLPSVMINQPSPNVGFSPVPGLSATFEGINCGGIETAYNTNYYFVTCSNPSNINQTNQTASIDTLTIKGRYVDRFTGLPLKNIGFWLLKSPSTNLGTFYTDANGNFAVTMSTLDITETVYNVMAHQANCYISDNGIVISRYPSSYKITGFDYQAGLLYVWINYFDLSRNPRFFPITSSEINVGEVPLWPSADISVNSDIPAAMNIAYPEEGRGSGTGCCTTNIYLRNVIPLNYNVQVKLTDNSGNIYYSQYTNVPLSNGCTPVNLNFFNKQFAWNASLQSNVTNQTKLAAPAATSQGWGITNDNSKKSSLFFHAINFVYSDPLPSAFRVYLRKPGENVFIPVAEFKNLSAPCGIITTTGPSILSTDWMIYRRCNSNDWKIDSYWLPTTGYSQGVYRLYLSAVDASGQEIKSTEFEMYSLQPLTILSPTSSQSPISPTPIFQWTVAGGWPTSPAQYFVSIYDDAKFGEPWIVHSKLVSTPISSSTATYVYDGPALDPTKKYVVRIYGLNRAFTTTICPSCDYISMDASTQTFWVSANLTTNQTSAQTCTGLSKYVDFEDPPQLSFHLTWNSDLGAQDSYNYNLDEAARTWLRGKGLVINGTPNGIVWGTKISGPVGATGVVIGDASPSFIENDQGISDDEILSVRFTDALTKSVTIGLAVTPSDVSLINNIPATVTLEAYDTVDSLVGTSTKTFTGVTNKVYTPTSISVSTANFNIAKIKLKATQYPYGGVWLEDVSFLSCT